VYKFVKAGYRNEGLFFILEDDRKVWGTCVGDERASGTQVYNYLKKTFKEGDEIDIDFYIEKDENGKDQYYVKRVSKKGSGYTKSVASTSTSRNFQSKKSYIHPPKVVDNKNESIIRQTVVKAVAQTMTGLQGYVDPNNVELIARKLYILYYDLVQMPIEEVYKNIN